MRAVGVWLVSKTPIYASLCARRYCSSFRVSGILSHSSPDHRRLFPAVPLRFASQPTSKLWRRLMKINRSVLTALLTILLACATPAFAQSDRGTITGTVTDPTGAAVGKAKITATNLESGEVRETASSDEGNYTLPEMKAGPWKLSIEAQGFKASALDRIQVAVQVTRTVDVKL